MVAKKYIVRSFFEKSVYLKNNVNIELRKDIVADFVGNIEGLRILDIGCGNGMVSMQLIAKNYVSFIDFAENMIEATANNIPDEHKKNAEIIHAELMKYKFQKKFDLILCIGVLAHVDSIELILTRINHLLTHDGRCILQISDRTKILSKVFDKNKSFRKNSYKVNYTTRSQLFKLTQKLGFKVEKHRYFWRSYPIFKIFNASTKIKLLLTLNKLTPVANLGSELFLMIDSPGNNQ
jgi:ubiquinone/menaquinone biosynthesis C-methylase UbiE